MSFEAKLDGILRRYRELGDTLASGSVDSKSLAKLSKEYSDLGPVVAAIEGLGRARVELAELEALRAGDDAEMRALAEQEFFALKDRLPGMERDLQAMLLPKDAADDKNAILEVRAGTGGEEAALFAAQLFRMYQRYAAARGWRFEIMELGETGLGGCREAVANITGAGVFARLKFESGVHRVQRVPATEASGRIHTSTATVAVLPEAEEVDVDIDQGDLQIDVYRSSGAGGQSVNTTDSAVRITHLPSGLVVTMQDERSQLQNRARAMQVLRSRLLQLEQDRQASATAAERRSQVGGGGRSEKIRTYNYKENRITDHRIGLTLYQLSNVLGGDLDPVVEALITEERTRQLTESSDV